MGALNDDLIENINKIGPYGLGNPKPKFLFHNVKVIKPKLIGETKKHLSYFITDDYFTNKTSTVTKIEMPQRLEGESILDYTKRIGNIVPKDTNPFFPSWVSNDMSVGDLDVSGILVTGGK